MKHLVLLLVFLIHIFVCSSQIISNGLNPTSFGLSKTVEIIVLSDTVFESNTLVRAKKVILKAGGKITLKDEKYPFGVHFYIECDIIEVQGNFIIDGRGKQGYPGAPNKFGTWTSKGPEGAWALCGSGHEEWLASGTHSNDIGGTGGPGGHGSHINVEYREFSGINGGLDNLQILTEGGVGGPGGIGLKLVCGCHPNENKYGPTGEEGLKGLSGSWKIKQL